MSRRGTDDMCLRLGGLLGVSGPRTWGRGTSAIWTSGSAGQPLWRLRRPEVAPQPQPQPAPTSPHNHHPVRVAFGRPPTALAIADRSRSLSIPLSCFKCTVCYVVVCSLTPAPFPTPLRRPRQTIVIESKGAYEQPCLPPQTKLQLRCRISL